MMISEHISLHEATKSQTATRLGIDNNPLPDTIQNMIYVARFIFEPARVFVGGPIHVSSFYRSLELNRAIGSKDSSQHPRGEAIDMDCDVYGGRTNAELFHWIKDNLQFDQLIWEFGTDTNPAWVHCSLRRVGTNRKQVIYLK